MTFGENIRARRKELGISVDELAEKLGKNRATIYRYENDEIEMPASLLKPMADALDTVPDFLMGWDTFTEGTEANDKRVRTVLPLLDNGVSVEQTDHSYIILKAPAYGGELQCDFCSILSVLYNLNASDCDVEMHKFRILAEISSTIGIDFLNSLVSYAEFLDTKWQEVTGNSYSHPYQLGVQAKILGMP
jgi:transcriptional regulator with XRE-family HTH domain